MVYRVDTTAVQVLEEILGDMDGDGTVFAVARLRNAGHGTLDSAGLVERTSSAAIPRRPMQADL